MKTDQEILARMKASPSFLGFEAEALLEFLSYAAAKEMFGEKAPPEAEWAEKPPTRENVLAQMKDYMAFAWGKAEDHRGISASRSVEKFEAWLWLLEDDQLAKDFDAASYQNYGCPKLKLLCERLGFPMPDSEGMLRMSRGEACTDSCESGCG